jgi:CDP-ribitol ribitolphosphotransferase
MYETTRDFYEKYEDIVPGQIIKHFDALLDALRNEDYDTERLDWFIEKNFTYTDGKATDRVIDTMILG